MATRVAEGPASSADLFLDTNVLLTASSPRHDHHEAVLNRLLSELPSLGTRLLVSHQILREYLVVATRPSSVNGLGLKLDQALGNIDQFRKRLRVLDDGDDPTKRLAELVRRYPCAGKQIHDAAIVATMLANRIRRLVTLDTAHFQRFSPLIEVVNPDDV